MNRSRLGFAAALLVVLVVAVIGTRTLTLSAASDSNTLLISTAVAATVSADNTARERQAPVLTAPDNNSALDNAAAVTLKWTWYRPLGDNEFYDLRVWQDGQPENGITWTADASFNLQNWLLYQ